MPQQQPRHTETSILQSYLIPPSPLPTILPYSAFLQLVPTQHRTHPHLKRLYRDLQFQRNIDVDTVRQNIDREVTRSATLKAQLARQIALEQNQDPPNYEANPGEISKKRKRGGGSNINTNITGTRTTNENDNDGNDLTNPIDIAIDTTYHTSTFHPAHRSNTLPPSQNHPLTTTTQKHHTRETLLSDLSSMSWNLEIEIVDLESETEVLRREMDEIVGSLSDLRYGRFTRGVGGREDGEEGRGVEDEVLDSLEELKRKIGEVV